jgi:hypothetical protein
MTKVEEIFKAWAIWFNPDDAQSALAAERIQICEGCEHKRTTPFIHCGLCGCALKAKIYSPVKGACPDNRWAEVDEKHLNQS